MRLLVFFFLISFTTANAQRLSLAGSWKVRLDSMPGKTYDISLPGTLDDAGIGFPLHAGTALNIATMAHLSRKVQYTGRARYSSSFTVPLSWRQKQVKLILGRIIWKSSISIDGKKVPGEGESLVTNHSFDLTNYIDPGKRQSIEITIDNSDFYPGINIIGSNYVAAESREMVHAYTNHTQIKWNGILGEITLQAQPATHLTQVTINPDPEKKELTLDYQIVNPDKVPVSLSAFVTDKRTGKQWKAAVNNQIIKSEKPSFSIAFNPDFTAWSEFSPALYQLTTLISSKGQTDTNRVDFGIRSLTVKNGNLHLNQQRIFIRSNLECIIFPLTGYPPMKESEWAELFTKAKTYGLNSFRFHSWCPPEAAFAAADKAGLYLQVELPHWNLKVGQDTATFNYLEREAYRILATYGNHASFMFFSMGNELEGDFSKLNRLVASLKKTDSRHLYATTTFTFQKGITGAPQPEDDYFVTQWTKNGWIRGQGIFNDKSPDFSTDYSAGAAGVSVPLISHEIGQYSIYPDIKEIALYKGNLVPLNFQAVKNDLQKKGLLPLAQDYLLASGRFATLLYKEEIERALKTKKFDGFQLLQLQDFPGQGTALVGLLNAFWKSKGVVTPTEFSRYCGPLTPLIRFDKVVYTTDEVFKAKVELANFWKPLTKAVVEYTIKDQQGSLIKKASYEAGNYAVDNCLTVGEINFSLKDITTAQKITVTVSVAGTGFSNNWNIWVYPSRLSEESTNVLITSSFEEARQALSAGRKVLLCPRPDTLKGITGKFVPVFWSPIHFPDNPGTMGLLIKNGHPAFASFPTDSHSNWQWWDLTTKSKALKMGAMPDAANLIRPIDNFVTNENLSSLFEAGSGKGKLIFTSFDIVTDLANRPQARQLRHSLLRYMNSQQFQPSWNIDAEDLRGLFK